MYDRWNDMPSLDNAKYRLMELKVAIQAEEAKFKLLTEGPNILAVKRMEDRLHRIEQDIQEANR